MNLDVNYEITTYTSDVDNASPTSNPFIAIYGQNQCTKEMPLVPNKADRDRYFQRGNVDKFVLEVDFLFQKSLIVLVSFIASSTSNPHCYILTSFLFYLYSADGRGGGPDS